MLSLSGIGIIVTYDLRICLRFLADAALVSISLFRLRGQKLCPLHSEWLRKQVSSDFTEHRIRKFCNNGFRCHFANVKSDMKTNFRLRKRHLTSKQE